ncbi:MAG: hypothetical protein QM776_10895 [Rhodocyclaceae bacterium]
MNDTTQLSTRQINALRMVLERRDFSAREVADIEYAEMLRAPGLGEKGLRAIRDWLASQGLNFRNAPSDDPSPRVTALRRKRLERAIALLEMHGYRVEGPDFD